jgi:hypothetical protein
MFHGIVGNSGILLQILADSYISLDILGDY